MKDRRVMTFQILVAARERQIKALETQLASLRAQYAQLEQATQEAQAALTRQIQEEDERNTRMQSLMSGTASIKVAELYDLRQYQGIVSERRVQLEAEVAKAQKVQNAKHEEIRGVQRQIAKNQGQIDEYKKLLGKMKQKAFKAAQDALDESAEESLLAQRRFRA